MPWLERARNETVEVCVLEVRGTNLWERAARGKNHGRTRLVGEHATSDDARAALAARVQELTSDGFMMIDPQASVDARRPAGRPLATDNRLRADDLRRALRTKLASLSAPRCEEVLGAFEAVFSSPRAYRTVSWECALSSGRVSLLAHLPASEGHVRHVGFELLLSAAALAERDLGDGDIFVAEMGENLQQFAGRLRACEPWRALASIECQDVDVYDEENG